MAWSGFAAGAISPPPVNVHTPESSYSDQQQSDRTLVVEGSGHESITLDVILADDLDRLDLLIANKNIDIVNQKKPPSSQR